MFKQYEYLNQLLSKNNSKTSQERLELFKGTGFIINRGKTSLDKWTSDTI